MAAMEIAARRAFPKQVVQLMQARLIGTEGPEKEKRDSHGKWIYP